MEVLFIILQNHDIQFNNNSLSLRDISSVTETSPVASPYALGNEIYQWCYTLRIARQGIFGEQEAVGRVGRKGDAKNSFQERAEEPLGADPY